MTRQYTYTLVLMAASISAPCLAQEHERHDGSGHAGIGAK